MSCWDTLNLSPTADTRAIKRAYAARLKETRPDEDPQAFQKLRSAYEEALIVAPWFDSENTEQEAETPMETEDISPAPQYASAEPEITRSEENTGEPLAGLPESAHAGAETLEPQPAEPEAEAFQNAFGSFLAHLDDDDALRWLDALLGDARWQLPHWRSLLEKSLLSRAANDLMTSGAGSWSQAFVARACWQAVLERAADSFGWLDYLPPDLASHAGLVDGIRVSLAGKSVDAVVNQAEREGVEEAAALLSAQLASPHYLHLDNRQLFYGSAADYRQSEIGKRFLGGEAR